MRAMAVSAGRILLFLALSLSGLSIAVLTVVHFGGQNWFADTRLRIAAEAGGALSGFITLCLLARFVDRRGWDTIGFNLSAAPIGLGGGTLLGAAIFGVPLALLMAMNYAHFTPQYARFTLDALVLALIFVFVNVVDQELLVRSYLFQEVWRKYSSTAAVTISTIVFVALHAGVIVKGLNGAIAGLDVMLASILICLAYIRSGALWLPIGIHFGWNMIQGPVLGVAVTGSDLGGQWHAFTFAGPALWTGGAIGIEGGLAGLAGPLLGIAFVLLFIKPHMAQKTSD